MEGGGCKGRVFCLNEGKKRRALCRVLPEALGPVGVEGVGCRGCRVSGCMLGAAGVRF